MPPLRPWPMRWSELAACNRYLPWVLPLLCGFEPKSRFDVQVIRKGEQLRGLLKRLRPTGIRTPGRRFVQAFCLILFLVLFFYYGWPHRFDYSGENVHGVAQIEFFLTLDPLLAVSTAIAARTMVWSLTVAAVVLLTCVVFPRWFCGYACPMGTLIDLFDWGIGRRIKRFRFTERGVWVNLRFYLLTSVIVAAVFGVLLSGFVAAIPVLTRGMLYIFAPLQLGLLRGWERVPPMNAGQYISILLFLVVLGLGLLRPRFWCAYLCPSGALLSLASTSGLTRRRVQSTCTQCGRCLRVCSFDAIAQDYSTRFLSCTTCKSCQIACPQQSIQFVSRWSNAKKKPSLEDTVLQSACTRRHFVFGLIGATGVGIGAATGLAHERGSYAESYPVRPPGSLPEDRFRRQCIRCGECLKVCPDNVLQPAGFELGIDGIWTPIVTADFSGCKPSCNNCGRVCPTGAIRELSLAEKRAARLGLAVIDTGTCLPHCRKEACGLCVDQCSAAGYNAIEYVRIGIEYDGRGLPIADSGFLAPVILADNCVGCGLCQARCRAVNVVDKKLLGESAVRIVAGPGKEDRIVAGSYRDLQSKRKENNRQLPIETTENEYLPDFLR